MAFKGVSCPFTCVTRLAWARSHSHLNWVDIEHVPKVLPRFEDHLTKLSLGGRRYKSVSATTLHYFRGGAKSWEMAFHDVWNRLRQTYFLGIWKSGASVGGGTPCQAFQPSGGVAVLERGCARSVMGSHAMWHLLQHSLGVWPPDSKIGADLV